MFNIFFSTGLAITFGLYGLWVFMAVVICWLLFSLVSYWDTYTTEKLFQDMRRLEIKDATKAKKSAYRDHASRTPPFSPPPSRKSTPSSFTDWGSDPSDPVLRHILFDTTSHSSYSGHSDGGSYSNDGGGYSGGDCGGGGGDGGGGSCD